MVATLEGPEARSGWFPPMKTVGILGAGQLGCMLAAALQKLGAHVRFFDPDAHAPGRAFTPWFTCAAWSDAKALEDFFASVDVVTYEFENVEVTHLSQVCEATGTPLFPSPQVLATTQSRASEKAFLAREGLPCAPFQVVETQGQLEHVFRALFASHAAPGRAIAIAKTLRGGYDGKGQVMVRLPSDLPSVAALLPCVLEEAIDLAFETSVITARTQQGGLQSFPVFENIHVNNILDTTLFPSPSLARASGHPGAAAKTLVNEAETCAQKLGLVGLLTTEFFLSRKPSQGLFANGGLAPVPGTDLYYGVNEFAPRPHNSGHVTREACFVSQFDAHARVLLNLPLPTLEPVSRDLFAMGNLLGDVWLAQAKETSGFTLNLSAWAQFPDVLAVTLYGKETARSGRKMGHFTLKSNDACARVQEFRTALSRHGNQANPIVSPDLKTQSHTPKTH